MIDTQNLSDEEFDEHLLKANAYWKDRIRQEPGRILYDYESDILQLKFGKPGLTILHCLDNDPDGFEWVVEDDTLRIVGVEIFYFRQDYAPRYLRLQAAYEALCRDRGEGDWFIDLPPQPENGKPTTASAFADALLDCAPDPVPVPDSKAPHPSP